MSAGQKVLLGNIRGPAGPPGDTSSAIPLVQKGAAGGVATLDGSSHVPAAQLALALLAAAAGAPNGVATLDGSSHVPAAQLANAILASALGVANGAASLDSSGQVPLSELGNVPVSKHDWQFFPEDYGAVGHAKLATDVATTSASQTFVSAQMAANASVGMWVAIDGGRGGDDTASVGVITSIVGNNVTITANGGRSITFSNTGLTAIYGVDDTNAINAALDAARAYGEAHNYDTEVLLTEGPYISATNTQSNNGTALYNTSIKIPYPSNNNGRKLVVALKGRERTDHLGYWSSSIPNVYSSTIFGLAAAPSTLDGTYGVQSVIGTPTPQAGMAGTISPTFVNTRPVVENVMVVTPVFTNLTAFDFSWATGCYMDGWSARAFAVTAVGNGVHLLAAYSGATIDATLGVGLRSPRGGNNADVYLGSFAVEGYASGISVWSEHTYAAYARLLYTSVALQVNGSNSGHGLVIAHVTAEGYKGGIQLLAGGTGNVPIFIGSWSTETSGDVYDIYDPGSAFQGIVNWYDNVDNRDIIVNGASNLRIVVPKILRSVPKVVTLTDGTTVPINSRDGNVFEWPLGANSHTLSNPSNPVAGQIITIDIAYSGVFTPNFGTAFKFGADGQPTWTSVSGKVDTIAFRYHAGKAAWLCLGWKLGY